MYRERYHSHTAKSIPFKEGNKQVQALVADRVLCYSQAKSGREKM